MKGNDKLKFVQLVVKQNSKLLENEIRVDGCYFMVLLSIYQMESGIVFTPYQINDIYKQAVRDNIIDKDCYINIGGARKLFIMASEIGGIVVDGQWLWNTQKDDPKEEHPDVTHRVALYKRPLGRKTYYHFVLCDLDGNVLFDPIYDSKTVKFGRLDSIRHYSVERIKIEG
jgi:hypothetical protein